MSPLDAAGAHTASCWHPTTPTGRRTPGTRADAVARLTIRGADSERDNQRSGPDASMAGANAAQMHWGLFC